MKEHNQNWPEISDHPYKILIIWGSRSGKTSALLNLINHEVDIDKNYLYAKDSYESVGTKYLNYSKAFIEYSDNMVDIYKTVE